MIKTRRMSNLDIDAISLIENKSFSMSWSREAFVREIDFNPTAYYFVIEDDKNIFGYMGIWKILDEGHITNIALDPDYRGNHYSNILLKFVINQMIEIGVKSFTLEVRESNIIAIKLYEKYGFVVKGKRKKYYSDTKEDALLMWKEIWYIF